MSQYPKLICFDWDGTLVDSMDVITKAMQMLAKKYDFPRPTKEMLEQHAGISLQGILDVFFKGKLSEKQFIDAYSKEYDKLSEPPLFRNARHVLEAVHHAGIAIAIVTNKDRASLTRELNAHDVEQYIDSIWVAEDYDAKPSPVMIRYAMTAHQAVSENTWMIGDSLADIYAASSAGCSKIAIVGTKTIPQWVENVFFVEDIQSVLQLLQESLDTK